MTGHQLPQLHVGHGSHFGALSVFPVWVDAPRIAGVDWAANALTVAEREGSPVVGELVLNNASRRPLVILEGDLLQGGWQDRMLARSLVLAPREARVADALCVEHGRWGGVSAHAARGRRSVPSVRHGNVSNDRISTDTDSQHEVWRRIGRYEIGLGATASSSMLDHLDRSKPVELRRLDGQRGVILGVGGRVIGAELFGSVTGLAARWQGILDAASLDARIAPTVRTTSSNARRFARALQAMTLEDGGDAGLARQLGSQQGNLRASGIGFGGPASVGNQIIHLTAFDDSHPLLENA
ncbi:ARPP-1 family domain-containing protein [Mycetocola zhadangensis]|uniref:ARPP-1 family domain-containing protein n=1 Tax=Mycetocola zhadangensis TaxID=1164595 RepID=UPI003A4D2386